jgi:zinc/manganese transport system substrate-binding protein
MGVQQRVDELARAAHIPIATVTETLSPASDSFEQWQVAELEGLGRALHRATGR